MSSFFKYSPNISSQNFAARKSGKKKLILVLFSWGFFDYVNGRYTIRYYIQKYVSESSKESQTGSEVVNPKRKTKPLLINETQEDDRLVIDEEYDIVIEK